MLKKIFQISLISCACFTVSVVNAGAIDGLVDGLKLIKEATSVQGNGAVGINANDTKKLEITAKAAGGSANSGLAVIDTNGGTQINVAGGYNSGEAIIKADSAGAGSRANAGLAVIDAGSAGRQANVALGYNSGTASISATATQAGVANAGLAVVQSK
ncbi:MAG: hypothetical protein JZU64_01150 [Rhodoferax sp.]|jgi:hypothetical protein|nr:hypothetical protein [Rhodoferax sp.]